MTSFILILLVIFTITISGHAQPGLPSDPSQAPIDGGLLWLILGGGAYAIKKLKVSSDRLEPGR